MAVDIFDFVAILSSGPRWLYQLDGLVAIALTVALLGMDAYRRRYH